jgi:hypothetical protein
MPASLCIAARSLALLTTVSLLASSASDALADNTATVRLSLINTSIAARNLADQPLWTRPLTDCSAIGTLSSILVGPPDNYKWFYSFSNVSPLAGSLGEFGPISFSTSVLSGNGRFAQNTAYTNIQITTQVSLLGKTFTAQNNAALSFLNGSAQDLSLIGGDLTLRAPGRMFYSSGDTEPQRFVLEGTPTLRIEIIPAPTGALALGSGLLALRCRRR